MGRKEQLASILKNEYGINSISEIDAAIARLGLIDISIFCSNISTKGNPKNDQTAEAGV